MRKSMAETGSVRPPSKRRGKRLLEDDGCSPPEVAAGHPHEFVDGDMVRRTLCVPARDVVFVKGVMDASEGLSAVFAQRRRGSPVKPWIQLTLAAPRSREEALDEVLADLRRELGLQGP